MTNTTFNIRNIFQKQIALPSDHGSWVFLLSPFLIGLFTARIWTQEILYLLAGLLAVFLLRQPAAITVKALSKRRSKKVLPAALAWLSFYSLIGGISFVNLARLGFAYLFWLAIPGLLVFTWHLWLVSQRSERYQIGIDIIASGTLALAAPAAYWVSIGESSSIGWVLWVLVWLQSAASIVYAFLRLEQRKLDSTPSKSGLLKMGQRALIYSTFNFLLSIVLSFSTILPTFIWIPYLLQLLETTWGTLNPAIQVKPTKIGLRQLFVSSLFTILFIFVW